MTELSRLHQRAWLSLCGAWVIALMSSLGVLFVGEVMGQAPCNLCWFQRAFMFPLVIVLGVACLRSDAQVWRYAVPLAVSGLLVAGFHTLLYVGLIPQRITPCTGGTSCTGSDMTIFGSLPLPLLAFFAFGAITVLLLAAASRKTS